jgi:hypothetical protein
MMARPAESAMQRIQVGLIGLLTVLLFVWVANLVLDRVGQEPVAGSEGAAVATKKSDELPKDEPLAELGVTPTVSSEAEPKADQPPAN